MRKIIYLKKEEDGTMTKVHEVETEDRTPAPKTLEQLQQELTDTMARAQQIMDDIANDNWIPF